MRPAEKDVLVAAERLFQSGVEGHGIWEGSTFKHTRGDTAIVPERWTEFAEAMIALIADRAPKPRWRVSDIYGSIFGIVGEDGSLFINIYRGHYPASKHDRDRIMELLNKADPA